MKKIPNAKPLESLVEAGVNQALAQNKRFDTVVLGIYSYNPTKPSEEDFPGYTRMVVCILDGEQEVYKSSASVRDSLVEKQLSNELLFEYVKGRNLARYRHIHHPMKRYSQWQR